MLAPGCPFQIAGAASDQVGLGSGSSCLSSASAEHGGELELERRRVLVDVQRHAAQARESAGEGAGGIDLAEQRELMRAGVVEFERERRLAVAVGEGPAPVPWKPWPA